MSELSDLKHIGLSIKSKIGLERLKNDEFFLQQKDAYKFAIALSLARGIIPPEVPPGGTTIFNTHTIDDDGSLAIAIKALMPDSLPPYRWAERLAEAGITILCEMADAGKLDVVAIISDEESVAEECLVDV